MASPNPAYKKANADDFVSFSPGKTLPEISEKANSIRAYSWEAHFIGLDMFNNTGGPQGLPTDFTLAAKQVSQAGYTVEDIEVNRVNDKYWYPGKATQDELVILFDNLLKNKASLQLWRWFKQIYDPLTGEQTKGVEAGTKGSFKCKKLEIIQLDGKMKPVLTTQYYGVYPKSYKPGEKNYSTNEMDTVEMTFRYDRMDIGDYNII